MLVPFGASTNEESVCSRPHPKAHRTMGGNTHNAYSLIDYNFHAKEFILHSSNGRNLSIGLQRIKISLEV